MRAISAAKQAVLNGHARAERVRIEVKDAGAVWRDLSAYPGFDSQISATWKETADDPHATAEVTLLREVDKQSLSPLMLDAAVNHNFDPLTAYSPLIALNREFRISVAVIPADQTPVSGDWEIFFHGRIDHFNLANADFITLGGRDLGGKLANTFIEEERVYGLASVAGDPVTCRIWKPGTVYALNEYVVPTEARRNVAGTPLFYKATTGGTSHATTEPGWAAGVVSDNTVTWTSQGATSPDVGFPVEKIIQNILSDWTPGITLYTPTTPSFNVSQYLQSRQSVMEAIRSLALLFGGDVRYKWRAGTAQFELTLFEPDRAKSSVDYQFGPDDYEDLTNLTQNIAGIRNVWQGVYSDAADKDASGRPKRKTYTASDSTSINQYDRLWAEIAEDEKTSKVDSLAEMTKMIDAALADTKDPKIEQEASFAHGFPWAEVGTDLYRFTANGRHYSLDQDLSAFGVEHTAADNALRTKLMCRGKPSAGFLRWHNVSSRNGEDAKALQLFESAGGFSVGLVPITGGVRIFITVSPERLALGEEYEYHVSDSAGFTPGTTTLKAVGRQRAQEVADLIPGKVYYVKIVPLTRDGDRVVRGLPSTEQSFTAGRANAAHLVSEVAWGQVPLNGSFETRTDPTGAPDHWNAFQFEGFGVHHQVSVNASDALSGSNYVSLYINNEVDTAGWQTNYFQVIEGETYSVEMWRRHRFGDPGETYNLTISWYEHDKFTLIGGSSLSIDLSDSQDVWKRSHFVATAPADAKYAIISIIIVGEVGEEKGLDIDSVQVYPYVPAQEAWVEETSLLNSWVNSDTTNYHKFGQHQQSDGKMAIRGRVKNGNLDTQVFTLAKTPLKKTYFPGNRVEINTSGHIIPKRGVYVEATSNNNNGGSGLNNGSHTDIKFEDEVEDTHSAYNTSTGVFTAPREAYYAIHARVAIDSPATSHTFLISIWKDIGGTLTEHRQGDRFIKPATAGLFGGGVSATFKLAVNERVKITVFVNAASVNLESATAANHLQIFEIGNNPMNEFDLEGIQVDVR